MSKRLHLAIAALPAAAVIGFTAPASADAVANFYKGKTVTVMVPTGLGATLGLGSYDAKTNVGADVEPLYVYSKSTVTIVNCLMKLFHGTMEYPIDKVKRVFHE